MATVGPVTLDYQTLALRAKQGTGTHCQGTNISMALSTCVLGALTGAAPYFLELKTLTTPRTGPLREK